MFKKLLTLVLLIGATSAFANGGSGAVAVSGSNSGADSTSVSKAISGDASAQSRQNLTIDQSSTNSGNVGGIDVSRSVPAAYAPGLATTLTETCMGSSSAGVGFSGFSASFGTTWRDSSCTRRLDARQLSAFGDLSTARELMCDSDKVRAAAKRAGRPCAEDGGAPFGVAVAAPVVEQVVPTPEAAAPVVNQQVHE